MTKGIIDKWAEGNKMIEPLRDESDVNWKEEVNNLKSQIEKVIDSEFVEWLSKEKTYTTDDLVLVIKQKLLGTEDGHD